jgi:hypothetical protein
MKKKILWVLLLLFIAIQFIRPARNESTELGKNDITNFYNVPADVTGILNRSCNDCHTNNTIYPWYANVQPVAWWLQNHVNEGKRELNFSEFGAYTPRKQDHKLEELIELVEKDAMPLNSYLWVHRSAKLSTEDKKLLTDWAKKLRAEIAAVK